MPFIRGRYYINPIAGAAIERAREADADAGGDGVGDAGGARDDRSGGAPVRRVEIEATEIVPAASGRAQRGFVARVHRGGAASNGGAGAETHVFADHRDLLGFLGGELGGE
jgi:hypothetical protein